MLANTHAQVYSAEIQLNKKHFDGRAWLQNTTGKDGTPGHLFRGINTNSHHGNALEHLGQIPHVVCVVALGWSWQEVPLDGLVDVHCG